MFGLRFYLRLAGLAAIAAALIWAYVQLTRGGEPPFWAGWFRRAPVAVDSTPVVRHSLRPIGELVTQTYYGETVVTARKPSANPLYRIAGYHDELALVVAGRLRYGWDLTRLDSGAVRVWRKADGRRTLELQLPPARALDTIVNPSDVSTFHEQGDWPQAAVAAQLARARRGLARHAAEDGAPARAEARAAAFFAELGAALRFDSTVVRFGSEQKW